MNNEAQTPKTQTHSCYAAKPATNKAPSTKEEEEEKTGFSPQRPPKKAEECKQKKTARPEEHRMGGNVGGAGGEGE